MSNKTDPISELKKKVDGIDLFLDGQSQNLSAGNLALLYVVLQALRKDKLAIELLDAAGYVCFDSNGKQIYPPLPKDVVKGQ